MKRSTFLNKNSKWKSLLFFFFLASLLWILTKISLEFVAPVTCELDFINVPESVSIKGTNADEVTFNLFAPGYEFLKYKLRKPTLSIDVSKYTDENQSSITISSSQLVKEINDQFPSSRSANMLDLDQLSLAIDPIIRKKIPVSVLRNVTYKNGFRQIGPVIVSPDSIFVSGPQNMIASIDSISTQNIDISLLEKGISEEVKILLPKNDGINISDQIVQVSWDVKEIAQKEFDIPVKVINKPSSEIIKIIPNTVKIKVDVTLDHFNLISAEEFEIVCDYGERNKDENFMIVHLNKKPEWAEHIEISTQKIDFLVFKE